MRKAMVLTFLLLTVTLAAVCVTAAGIYEQCDQVVLTENAVYGDIAAAEGLTVELHAHYANHLFWDTTCTFGQETTVETEYSFSAQARRQEWPPAHEGVTMHSDPMIGVDMSDDEDASGLEVAYRELLQETEVGEEGRRTIYLKDYLDYYPLEVNIGLPGVEVNVQEWEIANEESENGLISGTEAYVVAKLREYFRIPVLETEQYDIHVQNHSQPGAFGWGGGTASTESSDHYFMGTYSTYTADACYFTIETHGSGGELVDLSLLPDGYGIYRLPYEKPSTDENGVELCGVNVDALEMVYPLDPNIDLLCLDVSVDQTELMLHALEEDGYYMTVIDLATMETLQRLKIADRPVGLGSWVVHNEGDFLVVFVGEKLAVIDKNVSGQYVLRYFWDRKPEELESLPMSLYQSTTVLEYDGERLVMAGPLQRREYLIDGAVYRKEVTGFGVAVYAAEGMAYCGEYVSSLNTGRDLNSLGGNCQNLDYDALAVTWSE